jgi:nucleoid DNA-binding protein
MNRRTTITQIGQRTRLRNHDIQIVLEALIDVWSEALSRGEKIEIENFLVLDLKRIDRTGQRLGNLQRADGSHASPSAVRVELRARMSRRLRELVD